MSKTSQWNYQSVNNKTVKVSTTSQQNCQSVENIMGVVVVSLNHHELLSSV